MSQPANKSIMRSLGEFCGHVLKGVRTDPAAPGGPVSRVARERVEEELRDTPAGRVLVRRTVIEEILVPSAPPNVADATRDDGRRDGPRDGAR
ncbi:MAG: hypothetical protein WCK33_04290 [Phycisphaerae bacterium]|jgi:hypothetical protein